MKPACVVYVEMNYLLLFNQFAHMLQTPKKYIHSFWQRDATSRLSMKPTLAPALQKCNLIFCKFKESQTKVVFVFTQNTLYDRRRREKFGFNPKGSST